MNNCVALASVVVPDQCVKDTVPDEMEELERVLDKYDIELFSVAKLKQNDDKWYIYDNIFESLEDASLETKDSIAKNVLSVVNKKYEGVVDGFYIETGVHIAIGWADVSDTEPGAPAYVFWKTAVELDNKIKKVGGELAVWVQYDD